MSRSGSERPRNLKPSSLPWRGDIRIEELRKHNKPNDCWVVYEGMVYDLTSYLDKHPGGPKPILRCAGGDMTAAFKKAHRYISSHMFEQYMIGRFVA